jgi:RNA polymerase sigma-70 factor (ECF subfamily)
MLRRRRPEPDPEDPLFRPDPAPSPAAQAMAAGRDAAVRAAVAGLGADQAEVVRLAFFDGLSHAQIAAMTDLPLGTVKSRLRLAMERMRGALGDGFHTELHDD